MALSGKKNFFQKGVVVRELKGMVMVVLLYVKGIGLYKFSRVSHSKSEAEGMASQRKSY
jgi:hypothetical protein